MHNFPFCQPVGKPGEFSSDIVCNYTLKNKQGQWFSSHFFGTAECSILKISGALYPAPLHPYEDSALNLLGVTTGHLLFSVILKQGNNFFKDHGWQGLNFFLPHNLPFFIFSGGHIFKGFTHFPLTDYFLISHVSGYQYRQ